MRDVPLNRLSAVLESLDYPLSKAAVREWVSDITLLYADGEEPLADVVSRTNVDSFADAADLEAEIFSNLPVEAVGEPGQSEGEG
jgi:hypothetical protein